MSQNDSHISHNNVARLNTKNVKYRSMTNFNKDLFLNELQVSLNIFTCEDTNMAYDTLVDILVKSLDKHAPIKIKKVCRTHSRFMNKSLSKAIMKRSSLKSKYLKNKNNINRTNYKKQRNLCVKLRDNAIKSDFQKATSNIKTNNKSFFYLIKPYMTNKGALCSTDINLIENSKIITNEKEIAETFIEYYTNIVKYSSGINPANIADTLDPGTSVSDIVNQILVKYRDHPSITCINRSNAHLGTFKFQELSREEVTNELKSTNPKKSIVIDGLPPQIIHTSSEILAKPLTDIINTSIKENIFSSKAKVAAIIPLFKKDNR